MHKRLKNLTWMVITVLLLAACGRFEATPAPVDVSDPAVTENPTDSPEVVSVVTDTPTENFSQYIGLQYPPFPAGVSQDLSMLIQNSDKYGLFLMTEGTSKMLWLGKITGYDSNGNPQWEVQDVLGLSGLEAGLTLVPDGCLLNGVPDSEIFTAERNGVVQLAWRANMTLGKFEVLATEGIRCNSDKGIVLS